MEKDLNEEIVEEIIKNAEKEIKPDHLDILKSYLKTVDFDWLRGWVNLRMRIDDIYNDEQIEEYVTEIYDPLELYGYSTLTRFVEKTFESDEIFGVGAY